MTCPAELAIRKKGRQAERDFKKRKSTENTKEAEATSLALGTRSASPGFGLTDSDSSTAEVSLHSHALLEREVPVLGFTM